MLAVIIDGAEVRLVTDEPMLDGQNVLVVDYDDLEDRLVRKIPQGDGQTWPAAVWAQPIGKAGIGLTEIARNAGLLHVIPRLTREIAGRLARHLKLFT
jgi:hypothetical protein